MGRVLVLSDARYRPTPDLRAIVFPAVWTAALGRELPVTAPFWQVFKRPLLSEPDFQELRFVWHLMPEHS